MNNKIFVADVSKMQTQGVSNFLFHKIRTDFSSNFYKAAPETMRLHLVCQQNKSNKLEKNQKQK